MHGYFVSLGQKEIIPLPMKLPHNIDGKIHPDFRDTKMNYSHCSPKREIRKADSFGSKDFGAIL